MQLTYDLPVLKCIPLFFLLQQPNNRLETEILKLGGRVVRTAHDVGTVQVLFEPAKVPEFFSKSHYTLMAEDLMQLLATPSSKPFLDRIKSASLTKEQLQKILSGQNEEEKITSKKYSLLESAHIHSFLAGNPEVFEDSTKPFKRLEGQLRELIGNFFPRRDAEKIAFYVNVKCHCKAAAYS